MGQTKDKASGAPGVTTDHGSVGRVEVDSRGNSVWRWEREDGEDDSTSILLKRLENQDLALEPTQKVPVARPVKPGAKPAAKPGAKQGDKPRHELGLDEPAGPDAAGGFDPYNSRR